MVLGVFAATFITVVFSDLALQFIAGAIAAAVAGRAMRRGGFGLLGDLLIGVVGALTANFAISYFALFNLTRFGLLGELVVAVIGSILLVVLVHLFTPRHSVMGSEV
jgi:uncharacterized membrane protein YeaQ/YmgE (transglycosylase-associated protein family)